MSADAIKVYAQRKQGVSKDDTARGLVVQLAYETRGEDIQTVECLLTLLDSTYD